MDAAAPSPLVEGVGDYSAAGEGREKRALEIDVVTEAVDEDQTSAERDGGAGAPSFSVEIVAIWSREGAFFCGELIRHVIFVGFEGGELGRAKRRLVLEAVAVK